MRDAVLEELARTNNLGRALAVGDMLQRRYNATVRRLKSLWEAATRAIGALRRVVDTPVNAATWRALIAEPAPALVDQLAVKKGAVACTIHTPAHS